MPYKIVVTGPESCGKTSLCNYLAIRYKGKMIPEYSRDYLFKNPEYPDALAIEEMGVEQERLNNPDFVSHPIIFCDTDALNYLIWSVEIYGRHSKNLEMILEKNQAALYLLCFPDIPWSPDPLRQNPNDRERLFKLYLFEIYKLKLPFCLVSGIGIQRFNRANFFIENNFPEFGNFRL